MPKCDTTAENAAFEKEIGNILWFSFCKYIHCTLQWINDTEWEGGNTVYKRYDYPLAFTQVLAPLLGSTCGSTLGQASAEGASIQKVDNLGLSVLCEWSRGFIVSQITIIVLGM